MDLGAWCRRMATRGLCSGPDRTGVASRPRMSASHTAVSERKQSGEATTSPGERELEKRVAGVSRSDQLPGSNSFGFHTKEKGVDT